MKFKILLLLTIATLGTYSAMAVCNRNFCGGGPDFCCKDGFGATYYLTKGE